MAFITAGPRIWPIPPDWSNGVQERLAWSTDVLRASATAVTQHRGLRIGPRRSLTFELLVNGQDYRAAQMLLAGHGGVWLLPIWPDVQWLSEPLPAATDVIPCTTAGYDFRAGGQALLYTSVNIWEVVEIMAVDADHLAIAAPIAAAYPVGSRLYPLRRARAEPAAEQRLYNAQTARCSLAFDIAEPSDWPALAAATAYLGHPVLEARPNEADDLTRSDDRQPDSVDYGVALPVVHDLPGISLRTQHTQWTLHGRAEHTWMRSLFYTLQGRRVPIWLPGWADDLLPVAPLAGTALTVEWAGYTLFGFPQPNRRDLCIELDDGTHYYRRVTATTEAGGREILTLSAALSAGTIAPERIRQISIMSLATLASDEVEIEHVTDQDGVATVTLGFAAVVPDV